MRAHASILLLLAIVVALAARPADAWCYGWGCRRWGCGPYWCGRKLLSLAE